MRFEVYVVFMDLLYYFGFVVEFGFYGSVFFSEGGVDMGEIFCFWLCMIVSKGCRC